MKSRRTFVAFVTGAAAQAALAPLRAASPEPYAAPQFSFPTDPADATGKTLLPLALNVGQSISLTQFVHSALPLSWVPFESEFVSLSADGTLTAKRAGSAQIEVTVDDGH